MFDAFFDGSGNSVSQDEQWLILGGVSGGRDACKTTRDRWRKLLDRFGVDSLHMRAADGLTKCIGHERFEALVQGAIGILTEATFGGPDSGLLATVHGVRMDHFRDLGCLEPSVRTQPEELLSFHSLNDIYEWHRAYSHQENAETASRFAPGIRLVFDRGEGFRGHLVSVWSNRLHRKHHRRWELVEAIDEADAQDEPMLQAADVLAWSLRRALTSGAVEWQGRLAWDLLQTARVQKRVFKGEELRVAARSLSGQGERYRKGSRP